MKQIAAILLTLALSGPGLCAAEPLPGWRDTPVRKRLLDFVTAVTTPGGPGYVTPAARIAVFDDDGTLWPEKPRAQGMFALQRLRVMAPGHPEWRTRMPYAAALELGSKYLQEATDADVLQLVATASAGRTQDAFRQDVRDYFATARHPRFGRPWTQLTYGPMRELIALLKANGFRVFISTTGSIDLVRVLAEEMYGIPADDVFGSSVVATLREEDGQLVLRRLATVHGLNDGAMKPLTIDLHVGRRPILAVGNVNSGGDIDMLRYSQQPGVPNLQILIRHDDFEREYAYDEPDGASVKAANANGWLVVSMRYDWLRIFGAE
ncbi:MAG: haloacid dehalogenase-like hydrolase [Chromatiales bacterium]|nr:haloacid dehalogenase-like hydrolase [Chromatiales bacterium]